MGIKQLAKLLSDEAPECIKELPLSNLHGRKIAIDASMSIYQFLIAVRHGNASNTSSMLTNADGEPTSHIQGMLSRATRLLMEGVKPVYVFDGKPPNIKSGELLKRREKREKAEKALATAKEEGDIEEQDKQSKRLVRAGTKENNDCKRLLELMGIPIVNAPCEAEAQAAALCRSGEVWGVGTEDMDALTFACPILLRKMNFANASKSVIQQMTYSKAVEGLGLNHDQFVDLCILLGCDYCDPIKNVGPKTALKLIREHGCIEKILENIDRKRFLVPDDWIPNEKLEQAREKDGDEEQEEEEDESENEKDDETSKKTNDDVDSVPIYVRARQLFKEHEVITGLDLKWKECQPEPLTKFLVDEMGFNPDRVKSTIDKLKEAYKTHSKPQMRMDSFFKPIASASGTSKKQQKVGEKRKATTSGSAGGGKKKAAFGNKKR